MLILCWGSKNLVCCKNLIYACPLIKPTSSLSSSKNNTDEENFVKLIDACLLIKIHVQSSKIVVFVAGYHSLFQPKLFMGGQLMDLEHQRVTCANCGRNYKNEKEHKRHLQRNRCRGLGIMPVVPTLPAPPSQSGVPILAPLPSQSVVPILAPPSQSDLAGQESPTDLGNNLELE